MFSPALETLLQLPQADADLDVLVSYDSPWCRNTPMVLLETSLTNMPWRCSCSEGALGSAVPPV